MPSVHACVSVWVFKGLAETPQHLDLGILACKLPVLATLAKSTRECSGPCSRQSAPYRRRCRPCGCPSTNRTKRRACRGCRQARKRQARHGGVAAVVVACGPSPRNETPGRRCRRQPDTRCLRRKPRTARSPLRGYATSSPLSAARCRAAATPSRSYEPRSPRASGRPPSRERARRRRAPKGSSMTSWPVVGSITPVQRGRCRCRCDGRTTRVAAHQKRRHRVVAKKATSCAPRSTITRMMAYFKSVSLPGRTGIHLSDFDAICVYVGSMTTSLVPPSIASLM